MTTVSYHTMTLVKASKSTILGSIEGWLGENSFHLHSTTDSMPIIAVRYTRFPGFTDDQTGSKVSIIVRELEGVCAISIQHKIGRVLFVTGVMLGDILMAKSEQLVSHIKANI